MPDSTIMGVVVLFIGIVILIGLSPIILGNTTQDCSSLDGFTPAGFNHAKQTVSGDATVTLTAKERGGDPISVAVTRGNSQLADITHSVNNAGVYTFVIPRSGANSLTTHFVDYVNSNNLPFTAEKGGSSNPTISSETFALAGATPESITGWAKTCQETSDSSQDSFNVILVIPVVVAAVAILMVVRFL